MFADLDVRYARCDRPDRSAVGVSGLEVEGVELARPAVHPEQDARPASPRLRARLFGESAKPACVPRTEGPESSECQPLTAGEEGGHVRLLKFHRRRRYSRR